MFNLSYARNALVDTRGLETCLDGFLSNFIDFAVLVDVEDPIDQSHLRFPPTAAGNTHWCRDFPVQTRYVSDVDSDASASYQF
jgi:hypothetical protein